MCFRRHCRAEELQHEESEAAKEVPFSENHRRWVQLIANAILMADVGTVKQNPWRQHAMVMICVRVRVYVCVCAWCVCVRVAHDPPSATCCGGELQVIVAECPQDCGSPKPLKVSPVGCIKKRTLEHIQTSVFNVCTFSEGRSYLRVCLTARQVRETLTCS